MIKCAKYMLHTMKTIPQFIKLVIICISFSLSNSAQVYYMSDRNESRF